MIPVIKPYLPDRSEYNFYLEKIWERNWLTNNGPFLSELEKAVPAHLDSAPMSYVTNGTIALQLAIRALEIKGEVITTPYSYVATTSSILWEQCHPVFVDCLSDGNIDPTQIEMAITSQTTAILATHVYGFPCDVEAIRSIAEKHNLKVIYDAAHAFGVRFNGVSLFNYGDISTASFHATKLFHTIEGGGIFSSDASVRETIKLLRSFGHKGDEHYCLGINGKQSEFHAAMGLVVLKEVHQLIEERKLIYFRYREGISKKIALIQPLQTAVQWNYAYAPVLVPGGTDILKFISYMGQHGVGLRRYFYPALNQLPYLKDTNSCPVAEDLSSRVLALPIYNGLTEADQSYVIEKINAWMK